MPCIGSSAIPVGDRMHAVPFKPPPLLGNAHAQTLGGFFLGRLPGYRLNRVGLLNETAILPTQDGTGDRLFVYIHRYVDRAHHNAPAIVLLHGLEGDADSAYMVHLADKLLRAGFHVVRMNMRTCGPGGPIARRAYHAALTIDLESVLDYTREHISPVVAMAGISLGASLTLKLMGEDDQERDRQRILWGGKRRRKRKQPVADAFVAISPPLDLYLSCELLDSPGNRIYRANFLGEIKERARQGKYPDHPPGPELERELAQIKSFFDFDHRFVAPAAGFRGAVEYYLHASSQQFIPYITAPGLVLHARDDPLIHTSGWDTTDWDAVPNIVAHETRKGGHVGWVARKHPFFPDRRWMDYRVLNYLTLWRDAVQ
ncbi:MAG: hypothetical protein NXI24_04010 [bacterium]|nr:hypothetical protein [bacterium]